MNRPDVAKRIGDTNEEPGGFPEVEDRGNSKPGVEKPKEQKGIVMQDKAVAGNNEEVIDRLKNLYKAEDPRLNLHKDRKRINPEILKALAVLLVAMTPLILTFGDNAKKVFEAITNVIVPTLERFAEELAVVPYYDFVPPDGKYIENVREHPCYPPGKDLDAHLDQVIQCIQLVTNEVAVEFLATPKGDVIESLRQGTIILGNAIINDKQRVAIDMKEYIKRMRETQNERLGNMPANGDQEHVRAIALAQGGGGGFMLTAQPIPPPPPWLLPPQRSVDSLLMEELWKSSINVLRSYDIEYRRMKAAYFEDFTSILSDSASLFFVTYLLFLIAIAIFYSPISSFRVKRLYTTEGLEGLVKDLCRDAKVLPDGEATFSTSRFRKLVLANVGGAPATSQKSKVARIISRIFSWMLTPSSLGQRYDGLEWYLLSKLEETQIVRVTSRAGLDLIYSIDEETWCHYAKQDT